MARQDAESKGKPGWRFTLQAPSYIAVMTYLDDAAVREKVYRAYVTRGAKEPYDNRELILTILRLRREKARLLGYHDFADLVLEDRMAKTGHSAREFVDSLKTKTLAAFERETQELLAFRHEIEGPTPPISTPGTSRTTRRRCAKPSTTSKRKNFGPISPSRRCSTACSSLSAVSMASRSSRKRCSRLGQQRQVLLHRRCRRDPPRLLLRRLLSP